MKLWIYWYRIVARLRPACSRTQTFLWLVACLVGMSIRIELAGVTSIVRALGLKHYCYDRLLDFFHSRALSLQRLTELWVRAVLDFHPGILKVNQRILIVADGLKTPKSGKKMPGVKLLHQQAASNSKPEFIMGHSCQGLAILAGTLRTVFAIPLISRIQEGLVFSNRSKATLVDKILLLLDELGIQEVACYFIADNYYAAKKVIKGLMSRGHHLLSRLKPTATAYYPAPVSETKKGRGRPKIYGRKIKLKSLTQDPAAMIQSQSPVYGEQSVQILYRCEKGVGMLVRFVVVLHPHRGMIILLSTDLTLSPPLRLSASMVCALKSRSASNRHSIPSAPMPITSGWLP